MERSSKGTIKGHGCRVQSIKSPSIQHTTPEKTAASFKTNENNKESSDEESTTVELI